MATLTTVAGIGGTTGIVTGVKPLLVVGTSSRELGFSRAGRGLVCLGSSRSLSLCATALLGVASRPRSRALHVVNSSRQSLLYCGRGDRKTARGKRFSRSYGNARPRNKKKGRGPPRVPVPPSRRGRTGLTTGNRQD
ncbi:unnamed protein product [Spirodela intermedia]|uniref:Uncharacterized protein n=1 Tax=Spirodela intermedia TaxID=51605 RepID=A0A7I8JH35_SPIIN|nr:unnamed protein product [Spirodela intermedia]CAA6669457.1 unnamed protein product [Spirodela intermedia]